MVIVEFKRNGIKFAFSAPDEQHKAHKAAHRCARRSGYDHPADPHRAGRLPESACHAAFTVGIIWCLLFTSQRFSKAMNQMTKTCYDGITDAGPAVILMVGIGILFLAVTTQASRKF